MGSVFSPYYAWSGRGDPENHCAVNIALYRNGAHLWAMTERGRAALARSSDHVRIGPSAAHWDGDALRVAFDEWTAPLPGRLRGEIIVRIDRRFDQVFDLDGASRHLWRPIAPNALIEVSCATPSLRWRGRAYVDCNWGGEPPEHAFRHWDWSRAHIGGGRAAAHYDVQLRDGSRRSTSLLFGDAAEATPIASPPPYAQPLTFWRMQRAVRGGDAAPQLVKTLEDTPFYSRSWLRAHIDGRPADIFHESLSLERLRSPIVRAMLPFRMPRIAR